MSGMQSSRPTKALSHMIREAKPSDYEDMDAVFRASAKAFCSGSYDPDIIDDWTGTPWPDRFHIGSQNGDEQYVLTAKGAIICFSCINLQRQSLVSLFVLPEYSGQGVGQRMVEFVIERAATAGLHVLKLDSSLNAASFYKRQGFTELGRSKYLSQSGIYMDSVQMERAICP